MPTQAACRVVLQVRESTDDGRDHGDSEPIYNGGLLELWSGTDWQTVRYERAGRAHAFLVLEDDTTQTLHCPTLWFRLVRKGYLYKRARYEHDTPAWSYINLVSYMPWSYDQEGYNAVVADRLPVTVEARGAACPTRHRATDDHVHD